MENAFIFFFARTTWERPRRTLIIHLARRRFFPLFRTVDTAWTCARDVHRLVSLGRQITQARLKCTVARVRFFSERASRHFPRLCNPAITVAGHYLSKGRQTNYGFSTTLREETHKEINSNARFHTRSPPMRTFLRPPEIHNE